MPEDWKPHERDEFFQGYWAAKKGEPFWEFNSAPWIDGFNCHRNRVFAQAVPISAKLGQKIEEFTHE